jgi:hypothetical protein
MDSQTYDQMRDSLGDDLLRKLHASIDESVPVGTVEQRAPGRPAVRMSADSFVARTRAEMLPRLKVEVRALRKRERQNRKRGRAR